jgi:Zn-dependent membrane protease YugP
MLYIVIILVLISLLFGPQIWAKWILQKYSTPHPLLSGTGGEFAKHLLARLEIPNITVEETDQGDHYDPHARAVRLSPAQLNGKSLTAIVVAAHEVGHAIQDHYNYPPMRLRESLLRIAMFAEKLGSVILVAMPLITVLTRTPSTGVLMAAAGIAILGLPVLVHLVTLPVEFDASFGRALPILEAGYLEQPDMRAAHRILTACALTYVAASLATLLNVWRWIAILKR